MRVAQKSFDVAIVGGGPAGCAAAITLARQEVSVGVFERSHYENDRIGEIVSPSICEPLQKLGVWDDFVATQPLPLAGITSRWATSLAEETDYIFHPYGNGWILERKRFDAMLARVAARNGAHIFCGSRVVACRRQESGDWRIELQTGNRTQLVATRFIINATGRSSAVKGFDCRRIVADRLIAAVRRASLQGAAACNGQRMEIETSEDGWWYSTRLPDDDLVVAHLTDASCFPGDRDQRERIWDERFRLTQTGAGQTIPIFSRIHCFPAGTSCAGTVGGTGWVAIGDAALTVDPLSGQGILRALESGIKIASIVLTPVSRQSEKIDDYRRRILHRLEESVRQANAYYRLERRWPLSPFWSRRQESSINTAAAAIQLANVSPAAVRDS